MPLGDEKHKRIFDELVNLLGEGNVSDSRAVMKAYSRDCYATGVLQRRGPEFIVLPGSTEDVQAIVKLANRYKFPFSVIGSGLFQHIHGAVKDYWCKCTPRLSKGDCTTVSLQLAGKLAAWQIMFFMGCRLLGSELDMLLAMYWEWSGCYPMVRF